MKRMLTLTALAAMIAAGCSKEETGGPAVRRISIDPTVVEMKVSRATEVDFETGDAIGVTIAREGGAKYADNARFTFATGKFTSEDDLLWYDDINEKSSLVAYYPYAESAPTEFTVQADQSGDGYTRSDLMIASKDEVLPTVASTNMTFYHQLTKLVVNIDNQSGGTISEVVIKNAIPTAMVDLAVKSVTVKAGAGTADVQARVREAGKLYYAIIVPQTVGLRLAVTVTTDGVSKTLTQRHKELDLLRGQYSISIRVLPSDIDVQITGDIEDWEDNGDIPVDDGIEFTESENSFVYDGETYKTVVMKDGNKWMAENLRFVPKGKRISGDPTDNDADIWYPYTSDGTTCTPVIDAAGIAELGYLYAVETALGAPITPENSSSFEGVQGVCPPGWHIPTQADWIGLVGQTNKNAESVDLTDPTAPYFNTEYKGGKISELTADGFNFTFAGVRMRSNIAQAGSYTKNINSAGTGHLSMNYLMGSTLYKNNYSSTDDSLLTNIQYFAPSTSFTGAYPEGRLTVGYFGYKSGAPVRCVKDKAAI